MVDVKGAGRLDPAGLQDLLAYLQAPPAVYPSDGPPPVEPHSAAEAAVLQQHSVMFRMRYCAHAEAATVRADWCLTHTALYCPDDDCLSG